MKTNVLIPSIALTTVLIVAAIHSLPHTIGVTQYDGQSFDSQLYPVHRGQHRGYGQYSYEPYAKSWNFDWNQDSWVGNCPNSDYWNNYPDGEYYPSPRGWNYSDNDFQRYENIPDAPQGYGCPWMYY